MQKKQISEAVIAAIKVKNGASARSFVSRFGSLTAQQFFTEQLWLEAYYEARFFSNPAQMSMIVEILEQRGAQKVAKAVGTASHGQIFIEVFGLEAHALLPKHIASQVKGRHLEDALGL